MSIRDAYNSWAIQYDTNQNKTRDLEGIALRETLHPLNFEHCLEIGCGTGKNSQWLAEKSANLTAVDLSEEMLNGARQKVEAEHVSFVQADITKAWSFVDKHFDLISFSLVLEHIADLDHIFAEVNKVLHPGGFVYLGELHPFKQYTGTKARFDTESGRQIVECYTHNVSDFVLAGKQSDLKLIDMNEYFDEGNRSTIPRILTMLFQKPFSH